MDIAKIMNISQFLVQVSITVLPIGVAASSYIAQQKNSSAGLVALGAVWIGLMIFAASIFLNLSVIRTMEVKTPIQRRNFETKFQAGVSTFVIATICLVASPAGFATNQLITPKEVDLKLSSESIHFTISKPSAMNIVVTAHDINLKEYSSLSIDPVVSDPTCLAVSKVSEQPPAFAKGVWLTIWQISSQDTCANGDYSIVFNVETGRELRGQTQLLVKITP